MRLIWNSLVAITVCHVVACEDDSRGETREVSEVVETDGVTADAEQDEREMDLPTDIAMGEDTADLEEDTVDLEEEAVEDSSGPPDLDDARAHTDVDDFGDVEDLRDTNDPDDSVDGSGDTGSTSETCTGEWGTTYFVRVDGGDPTQCTGLVDAAYPGTGTGQPCAWSSPMYALPPSGSARISGGDRLVINAGTYGVGFGAAPGVSCFDADTAPCVMASIPSGLSEAQPTCIVGAGWNDGCDAPPELFGVERLQTILDLTNSEHVRVECLELTDHEGCVYAHSGSLTCAHSDPASGDWASNGIYATDSTDVTLRNLDIHGLAEHGILAGRLTDWSLMNVDIIGNGWAGFDGDVAGSDGNTGTTLFDHVTVAYNGCGETYPGREPTGCWGGGAGGYGDGLGTGATGGDWVFRDTVFSHNASDGLDLLYHDQGGTITIDRVRAEGNAGNQVKTFGATHITNSVIVGNCGYFSEQPFNYWVDDCRALGNALSVVFGSANQISLVNSTIYSEGDCLVLVGSSCGAVANFVSRNNVFLGGVDFLQPEQRSCFYYSECGALSFDQDWGVIDGTKHDDSCPFGDNDICADPELIGPFSGDAFGLEPDPDSPAVDSGLGVGALGLIPAIDFNQEPRPAGDSVDRGAYELQ